MTMKKNVYESNVHYKHNECGIQTEICKQSSYRLQEVKNDEMMLRTFGNLCA